MDILESAIIEYRNWCESIKDDPYSIEELSKLETHGEELLECFGGDLGFGTSGIRGLIGIGPRRINKYVIARATQGIANYINNEYEAHDFNKKVVIGYDTRLFSKEFAEETARVLSGNGISAYIFPEVTPVPVLSYSIDKLGCDYGIMITASHNAGVFNGYKVYNKYGYQIVGDEPERILEEISKLDYFKDINRSDDNIITLDDSIKESYLSDVRSITSFLNENNEGKDIKIVYTPLNGAGNSYIKESLKSAGFANIISVPRQEVIDPNFTTCKNPNPEKLSSFTEAFRILDENDADIIIASDPDSDRVGIALIHEGTKINLSGNQIGLLILDYLCKLRDTNGSMNCYRSIVSTPLMDRIADAYGLNVVTTLIGFKYIGEEIQNLSQSGEESNYFFGFEESNGFLINPFIKDKDAISTAVVIASMAAYHKSKGKDLADHLNEIYDNYGTLIDKSKSFTFEGLSGQSTMEDIMNHLRNDIKDQIGDLFIEEKTDYLYDETGLPKSDIIRFDMDDGSTAIVRPSGTEPKIKVYFFLTDPTSTIDRGITKIMDSFK